MKTIIANLWPATEKQKANGIMLTGSLRDTKERVILAKNKFRRPGRKDAEYLLSLNPFEDEKKPEVKKNEGEVQF